jgi:acetyl esterase/lipase
LHRLDLASGKLSDLDSATGTIGAAGVRDDGTVEYLWSSAASPSKVRALGPDGTDEVLLTPPGPVAPGSTAVSDVFVDGPGGQVHALVARPADAPDGPLPTVFSIHGGPHAADEDRFSAYRATWLDAGFAVVEVNYRGSTGYGSAWRDAIEGRPGLTELEDIAAVHDWAVRDGFADPKRIVVEGASWGGYLTLLALGTQPDRWAAGIAVVPVADYVTAYADEMEPLRDFDRALFGGSPDEVPERYRVSSPLTYVDDVRVPVLVTAGENDPRCPIQQVDNYLDRLAARDAPHSVYRFDAGHGSLVVAETIKQTALAVDFARRAVAGGPRPARSFPLLRAGPASDGQPDGQRWSARYGQADLDVPLRRLRVRAHLVRLRDQPVRRLGLDAGQRGHQRHGQAETVAVPADADLRVDRRGRVEGDATLAGHPAQRVVEAGRVTGGEQLLRVGEQAAGPAHLLRHRQLLVDHAVRRVHLTVAAVADRGGLGGVQGFDGHRELRSVVAYSTTPGARRSSRPVTAVPGAGGRRSRPPGGRWCAGSG